MVVEPMKKTLPPSTSGRHGPKATKVTLGSFDTPRAERIAKIGHSLIRQYISVTDAFPPALKKDELCWKVLVEGAKGDKQLTVLLKELDNDLTKKKKLIDYVSNDPIDRLVLIITFNFNRVGAVPPKYAVS
jgi:hypothetical protein